MAERAEFRIVDGPLRGLTVIVPPTAVGKPIRLSDLGHQHLTSTHQGHYLPVLEAADGIDGRALRWIVRPGGGLRAQVEGEGRRSLVD